MGLVEAVSGSCVLWCAVAPRAVRAALVLLAGALALLTRDDARRRVARETLRLLLTHPRRRA
jgi:hypothetical protein